MKLNSNHTTLFKRQRGLFYTFFIGFLLLFQIGYSQEEVEIISHRVELGETILMISKKYLVQPTEIYRLNKSAVNGISEGMTLSIPQPLKSKEIIQNRIKKKEKEVPVIEELSIENQNKIEAIENQEIQNKPDVQEIKEIIKKTEPESNTHTEPIVKQYCDHEVITGETLTSLARLYDINVQDIKNANEKLLKNGLKAGSVLSILINENTNQTSEILKHKVAPGETLYSISRKYAISVEEIKKLNTKELANGLKSGQEIFIKQKK